MKLRDVCLMPNKSLERYLDKVVSGNKIIVRTTFAKKQDPQKVLTDWMRVLRACVLPDGLWEFEYDLANKVGPMSWMLPLRERLKDVDSYYESILKDSRPLPAAAIDALLQEWSSLTAVTNKSLKATVLDMRLSTNSGCPYFTRRSKVLNQSVAAKLDDGVWYYPDGAWEAAAILGWRGQEGGPTVEDVKQRVVFMFPFAVNIHELSFYQPLIECAQNNNLVPAWIGNDAVDDRITQLFDTKGPNDDIICTDFSAFDQHFNPDMSNAALTVFKHTKVDQGWLEDIYPIKYNIPLVLDQYNIREGIHGMGSGSGGTNADETITHRILQHEAAIKAGSVLNPNSMCLGDDGILTYPGIRVEQVVDTYSSHGQEMNLSKQMVSKTDCVYLRRWHSMDYRIKGICKGVYSTCRALGRLLYQERFYDPDVWGPKAVAIRQLSVLQNIEWHPVREKFAAWCMKRDKYRLGIDIPGFLDNIVDEFEKFKANIPNGLSYTQELEGKGIENWWIVQFLKDRS